MTAVINKFSGTYSKLLEKIAISSNKNAPLIKFKIKYQTAAHVANEIVRDIDRTRFIDLSGKTVAEIKKLWLQLPINDTKSENYYYVQGDMDARSIAHLFMAQKIVPYANLNTAEGDRIFNELSLPENYKEISFSYLNAQGNTAGFTLKAIKGDSKGDHKGWILATINDALADPAKRQVTVLGSANYVSLPVRVSGQMGMLASLPQVSLSSTRSVLLEHQEQIIKKAINNDAIFELVKGAFAVDGSINLHYMDELSARMSGYNLDNRDFKKQQLEFLMNAANKLKNPKLEVQIALLKNAMVHDSEFFKTPAFNLYLDCFVDICVADGLDDGEDGFNNPVVMKRYLLKCSKSIAELKLLAQKYQKEPLIADIFSSLVEKIIIILDDETNEDVYALESLMSAKITNIERKVLEYCESNDKRMVAYRDNKKKLDGAIQAKMENIAVPKTNFWSGTGGILTLAASMLVTLVCTPGLIVGVTASAISGPSAIALVVTVGLILLVQLAAVMRNVLFSFVESGQKQKEFAGSMRACNQEYSIGLDGLNRTLVSSLRLEEFVDLVKEVPENDTKVVGSQTRLDAPVSGNSAGFFNNMITPSPSSATQMLGQTTQHLGYT